MTWDGFFTIAAAPATVALLHRYFLSFANSLPDLAPDAGYTKRTAFNLIQGIAGNEHRVIISIVSVAAPNAASIPNELSKGLTK